MNVCGWDKWQTFRKDRGTPPWIKVYRNLLTNPEWVSLTDAEKGQLVSIWLIAADKGGHVPDSPVVIQKMAMLDSPPNLNKFIGLGFLTAPCQPDGNHPVTSCPESDAPETEKSRDRVETETTLSRNRDPERKILSYLNQKTGKGFKPVESNLRLLSARLAEGHTQETVCAVIDRRCSEWGDSDKWSKYLRPKTLFAATNFNQYVGELTIPRKLSEKEKTEAWINGTDGIDDFIPGEFTHEN